MGRMETYDDSMAPRFRELLASRATQLGHTLDQELQALDSARTPEVTDFKDAAAGESQAEVEQAQAAQADTELGQIRAALARLAKGTYGRCTDCGEAIDLRRLMSLPATSFCTGCQQARERARF